MCVPSLGCDSWGCSHGGTSRNPLAAACSVVLPQPGLKAAACPGVAATEDCCEDLVCR